ncbi:MAG: Plug domain-containing protein, partial [Bacteroidia bacterium]|nr:Plug domain-containing protein [Bacteroidia bacterium]
MYFYSFLVAILIGFLLPMVSFSQLVFPVEIESERFFEPQRVIQSDSLGRLGNYSNSLESIISRLEGAYLRQYGGHGGVQTLSLRGFATNQTTISINDVPFEQIQTGTVNLSPIPANLVSGLELQSAGCSNQQNPLAGNLNLNLLATPNQWQAGIGSGAFGEQLSWFNNRILKRNHQFSVALLTMAAKDNFRYQENHTWQVRQASSFRQFTQNIAWQWKKQGWEAEAFALTWQNKQMIPPPVVQGNSTSLPEKLSQQEVFAYQKAVWKPSLSQELNLNLRYQYGFWEHEPPFLRSVFSRNQCSFYGGWKIRFRKQLLEPHLSIGNSLLNGNRLEYQNQV